MAERWSSEKRSEVMARIGSRDTGPERAIRSVLHAMGYRFRLHRKDLPGSPDIVLPRHKTVIFVHGCFWHRHDCPRATLPKTNREFWAEKLMRNAERDCKAQKRLNEAGWRVIIVWQCAIRKRSLGTLAEWLRAALGGAKHTEISRLGLT